MIGNKLNCNDEHGNVLQALYGIFQFPLSSLSSGWEFSVSTSLFGEADHHGTITSQNKFLLEF